MVHTYQSSFLRSTASKGNETSFTLTNSCASVKDAVAERGVKDCQSLQGSSTLRFC
jgi:hypothetical protein